MIVVPGKAADIDPEFIDCVTGAVIDFYALLSRVGLDTPEVRSYLEDVRVISNLRLVSTFGRANYNEHTIDLNFRLLRLLPQCVLDYVMTHECAHHLAMMPIEGGEIGHGPAFQKIMRTLGMPMPPPLPSYASAIRSMEISGAKIARRFFNVEPPRFRVAGVDPVVFEPIEGCEPDLDF
jgi:hypothetical protein